MTVFNFPDTAGKPTDGSFTWTAPSGVLYVWNGDAWVTQGSGGSSGGGGSKVYVTDNLTTIADPEVGDLAYHTIEARLYVYYQDSDSQQWVDASPAGDANDLGGDSLWSRVGSTLSPAFTGDDLDNIGNIDASGFINALGGAYSRTGDANGKLFIGQQTDFTEVFSVTNTGDLSAAAGTFAGGELTIDNGANKGYIIGTPGNAANNGWGRFFRINEGTTAEHSRLDLVAGSTTASNAHSLNIGKQKGDGSGVDFNITLNANGQLVLGNDFPSGKEGSHIYPTGQANLYRATAANQATWIWYSDIGGTRVPKIEFRTNGSAKFASVVAENQVITRSVTIDLEPDNPANYTTEEVDGEEVQVYSGPTLDVKEKLLDFVARIEALEATNASLEARLTALEGGN